MTSTLQQLDILNLYLNSLEALLTSDHRIGSVIILGAGISGLSAGSILSKFPAFSTKLLEGRDRIGGRIHSIPYHLSDGTDIVLDLGASWIHGIGKGTFDDKSWKGQWNPIYRIA